jgi:hypothetical protein
LLAPMLMREIAGVLTVGVSDGDIRDRPGGA